MLAMRRRIITITIACISLVLFGLIWLRKSGVPLVANGKTIAVAKESFFLPWKDGELDVYAGNTNLFSIWEDFFDFPVFIYPFADGNRFLCIDDDDTSVLVFVVDFNPSATNDAQSPLWPPDSYVRTYIAGRMTNVVMNTKGFVRLPTLSELQETSSYLANSRSGQIEKNSFGVYNSRWPNQKLLSELATNRNSVWP